MLARIEHILQNNFHPAIVSNELILLFFARLAVVLLTVDVTFNQD